MDGRSSLCLNTSSCPDCTPAHTHARVFTPACETPSTSTPTHTRSRSHTHRTLARHMCKDVEAAHPRLGGGVNVSVGVARGGDGKALVFDGDYYGDCVNVASKLGALATSTPFSSSLHSAMPQTRLALCSLHRQGSTDVSHILDAWFSLPFSHRIYLVQR
jgi:hypothetical protein